MLRESFLCGRTLISPTVCLTGLHNFGRTIRTQLSDYYDLENATVEGTHVPVLLGRDAASHSIATEVSAQTDLRGHLSDHIVKNLAGHSLVRFPLGECYPDLGKLSVNVKIHPNLQTIADSLALEIPTDAAWVHVRRGDLLKKTSVGTSPENIHRVLQETAPQTKAIYIATNEINLHVFKPLTELYDVACFEDFPELVNLTKEDNYKSFLVEQAFGEQFPTRISTFKTTGRNFHGHLCDEKGWQ